MTLAFRHDEDTYLDVHLKCQNDNLYIRNVNANFIISIHNHND